MTFWFKRSYCSSSLHRSLMSLKTPFDTQKLFKCKTIQKPGSWNQQPTSRTTKKEHINNCSIVQLHFIWDQWTEVLPTKMWNHFWRSNLIFWTLVLLKTVVFTKNSSQKVPPQKSSKKYPKILNNLPKKSIKLPNNFSKNS